MSTRHRGAGLDSAPALARRARVHAQRALILGLVLGLTVPAGARANQPLSAIGWLSKSVRDPAAPGPVGPSGPDSAVPAPGAPFGHAAPAIPLPGVPPVGQPFGATGSRAAALPDTLSQGSGSASASGGGGNAGQVTVSVLRKGPALDAVGLLPVSKTGLPRDLWGATPTKDLVQLIRKAKIPTLPALRHLFTVLMLAEVNPPDDSTGDGSLLLARVDRLLDLGALNQAQALLEMAGTDRPDLFRRWFDIALLLGDEDRACKVMRAQPDVAPTYPARIFCLARSGDWNAAALTLQNAEALGYITGEKAELLKRFLDPEIEEDAPPLPPPSRPSPLVWRMMEAIGEPMPTNTLPVAFAQGDLRSNTGWKQQIEAAERLTRTGAIPPNQLLALYTERKPAASGGVWDRVARIQTFDSALTRHDIGAVRRSLPPVWAAMSKAQLQVPFAQLYGSKLAALPLSGKTAALAFRIGLLSGNYAEIARAHAPADANEAFLKGIALGRLQGTTPPDATGRAIADALGHPPPVPPALAALVKGHREGEALLRAIGSVATSDGGDLRGVIACLATLRSVGLTGVARQTALQLMILGPRE